MEDQLVPAVPFGPHELQNLECIKSGRLSMGEQTRRFEQSFAIEVGAKFAVMVNSGSSANLLAVSVLKVLCPDVKTVALPAVTWSTTLAPIVQLGLSPVFMDVNPDTLVSGGSESKPADALFAVHLLGQPCNLAADPRTTIEDCCEALGTRCGDQRPAGSRGLMGTFSFYYGHHLTTIEGGMVVTSNEVAYDELVMQRAHGWIRDLAPDRQERWKTRHPDLDPRFLFPTLGFNVRPTEIQAELGRQQLPHLRLWRERRRQIAERLQEVKPAGFWRYCVNASQHSWFAFPLVLADGGYPERNRLAAHFKARGIPTRPIVAGDLTAQPLMLRFGLRQLRPLDQARHIQQHGLYLAISPLMSDEYVDKMARALAAWK